MTLADMTGMTSKRWIGRLTAIGVCAGATLLANGAATAQTATEQSDSSAPIVVEYFMSQSCSSCMAATDFFGQLAGRDDIVALSWHVDYWNILNTKKGRWVDPYSSADYTDRQRRYNKTIRQRSSVYTPQMVIAGVSEASGRAPGKVVSLIDAAKAEQPVKITAKTDVDMGMVFEISKSDEGGNAYLITLLPEITTKVTQGENAGHIYTDVNVVTGIRPLGLVRKTGTQINAPIPIDGEHCALIIQEPKQGRIITATYCPVP